MNKIDLAFGETFCVLPWIEDYKNLLGQQKFCCWSDKIIDNKDQASSLRQKIWNKEKIPHCESCYRLEANTTISPRQKETAHWFKHQDIREYFNSEHCPEFRPLFLDLRTNNKCNLACISCGPASSSLWGKELGIKIESQNELVNLKEIHRYKKIYMAGGEPLIIEDYLKVLNFVAENNLDIEIVINTNLTNLSKTIVDAISKIKKISLTVSVDSYDKVNEYHRYPIKWSKFLDNLMLVHDLKINIDFNTVVDAVSVFGLGDLTQISHIPNSWNLFVLTYPNWLQLRNIPKNHKQLALGNLIKLKDNKFFYKDVVFRTMINQIEQEIMTEGDSTLLAKQIQILDSRRKINHENYMGFRFY